MLIGIDASRANSTERTGTEGYAYHLIEQLIAQTTGSEHQLRLYFNQPPPVDLFPTARHVEVVSLPLRRLWTHLRLGWELEQDPPDVFFTPAHVIPATYRGPSVATVHDLGYHHFPEAHPRTQVAYLRWSTRQNARRSQRVIADSRATRADLVRFYGTDPEKIEVVYPGLDPALEPVRDEKRLRAARERYGLPPRYLLYLGTLQPRKNLSRLVEAYIASGVEEDLVLAGRKGWLAQPLLEQIAALPAALSERIHLPGYVDEAHKAALLSGATALLYPSLYEGFGFPVLEAQACSTAVLCANNSSLPEVAGNGALLVDANDTAAIAAGIRNLVFEEALQRELVAAGLKNVERFGWERAGRQVLTVLEETGGETQ